MAAKKRKSRPAKAKTGRHGAGAKRGRAGAAQSQTLGQRLQRRDTWPRSWWYPEQPQRTQKDASEAVQKNYEECVATVRRTMLVLLGFCLFAIVVTFGTPDSSLITAEAKVDLPFAESKIEFLGFLVAAPALLIVLTLYLHIFDTSRRERESTYKLSPVPALFTIPRRLPTGLTYLIFFWLVPIVLAAITWKALARFWWGLPLLILTLAVTGALIWIQIRRRPADERAKNMPLWGVLAGLVFIAGLAAWDTLAHRAGLTAQQFDIFHRGLNLFRADLSGKWLVNADLRDADLRYASLEGANLTAANLQGADLGDAQFKDANLTSAQLQRADLGEADLKDVTLSKADLQGAKNLRQAKLRGADLSEVNLQGQDLSKFDLEDMNLKGAQLQGADLQETNLRGSELQSANLSSTQLESADLSKAELQGADLREAKLQDANLRGAKLQGADLSHAQLQGANLSESEFQNGYSQPAQLQGAKFRGADLRGTNFRSANLRGADFYAAKLQGADLREAILQGAFFSTAELQGADLSEADLQDANLKYAQLQGADLTQSRVWHADLPLDFADQSPRPVGLATVDSSALTEIEGVKLRRQVETELPDRKVQETVRRSLNAILHDHPPKWTDEARWSKYRSEAMEPSPDELAKFLAGIACGDAALAEQLGKRADRYNSTPDRKPYAKPLAQALLNSECAGRALTDWTRARLKWLVPATE